MITDTVVKQKVRLFKPSKIWLRGNLTHATKSQLLELVEKTTPDRDLKFRVVDDPAFNWKVLGSIDNPTPELISLADELMVLNVDECIRYCIAETVGDSSLSQLCKHEIYEAMHTREIDAECSRLICRYVRDGFITAITEDEDPKVELIEVSSNGVAPMLFFDCRFKARDNDKYARALSRELAGMCEEGQAKLNFLDTEDGCLEVNGSVWRPHAGHERLFRRYGIPVVIFEGS